MTKLVLRFSAFPVFVVIQFSQISCTGPDEVNESALDWDLLGYSAGMMRNVGSGISICPTTRESEAYLSTAIRAVQTWLQPLKNSGAQLSNGVDRSCPGDMSITYSQQVTRAHALVKSYPEIRIGPNELSRMPMVMLHEMGHAFGLNDTYVEGVWTCKDGQPTSVMCKANSTNLQSDDVKGIIAAYERVFGPLQATDNRPVAPVDNSSEGDDSISIATGSSNSGGSISGGSGNSDDSPPVLRGSQKLRCNQDFSAIRAGGSGICRNESSGFCYRYGAGRIAYETGSTSCAGSTVVATDDDPNPSALSNGSAKLDCNSDYSKIRSGLVGICINQSSGNCYRYGRGDVQYSSGSVACI